MQLAHSHLNGPARGARSRFCAMLVLLLSSLAAMLLMNDVANAASGGSGSAPPVTAGSRYLALGDSVTFGYEEPSVVPAPNYSNASSFIGYPELLASELHLKVTNAACPGETSASMISVSAQSNGCENTPGDAHAGYRLSHPLHVRYKGSQLAFAVRYLRSHRNVSLVSLMIGANDGLICIETTKDGCSSSAERNAVLQAVAKNIRDILHAIRQRGHYGGQLVIVNYFSPLTGYDAYTVELNHAIDAAAKPFHVRVANGYGVFKVAERHSGGDPCTAELVTQLGKPGKCGIHPSYAGHALLALAVEKAIRL